MEAHFNPLNTDNFPLFIHVSKPCEMREENATLGIILDYATHQPAFEHGIVPSGLIHLLFLLLDFLYPVFNHSI